MMRAQQLLIAVALAAVATSAYAASARAQGSITVPAVIERAKAVGEGLNARQIALQYLAGQVEQVIVRLGEIEAQNEALRSERATLKWQLGEMADAHRALEKEFNVTKQRKEQQLAALQDHLSALTEELKAERGIRDALQTESSTLELQLDEATTARTVFERAAESREQRAESQLQALQQQLAALTVELNVTKQRKEQQLAALQDHLSALTEELKAERGIRDALQTESSTLELQLDEATTARTVFERAAESREQRAESQLQALQQQLAALTVELNVTKQRKEQQLAALQDHLSALTEELKAERGIRDALQTESSTLELQLDEATTARTVFERAAESREQRAESQLQALQQQLAALTVELESERAVRDALARQGTTLADTVAALHRERTDLTSDLATARGTIGQRTREIDHQRAEISMLSDQVAALRADLKEFKEALAAAQIRSSDQEQNIDELGRGLNAALAARVRELAKYRSEFFGRLRDVLGDRTDVRVVGDRFVLQSELLFASGSARIGRSGKRELGALAAAIKQLAALIPSDVDWILRIDGHTDRVPIVTDHFTSNWELSTARAVSVVEFLVSQGISPRRLAATGFGEFQPIDDRRDEIAYRRNRRIEFKLTQR